MKRSQMYSFAVDNYVPGNVKFLDKDGKFHDLGSAYTASDKFVFVEGETPMPRHHLCSMLELDEGDDPRSREYPVMVKIYGIHGKTTFHEIQSSYMDGHDLVFSETLGEHRPQMKTFEQVLQDIPEEYSLEDECWYKSSDIRGFLVKLKAAHELDMSELQRKYAFRGSYVEMLRRKISAISEGMSNG